jgi:phosphinothricin acetyltransferase
MTSLEIDRALPADVDAIAAILNDAIENTTASWYDLPRTPEQVAAWIDDRTRSAHPFLVARRAGSVVGFSSYGPFRPWPGYRQTVELSIFVDRAHHRQGIGRKLVEALVDKARQAGVHVIVAGIEANNRASIELHRALGFVEVGRMPEVGRKFDRWLTLVFMQRTM